MATPTPLERTKRTMSSTLDKTWRILEEVAGFIEEEVQLRFIQVPGLR